MAEVTIGWFAGVDWGSQQHQACAAVREGALADDRAGAVEQADLVPLRSPVDAGEPAFRLARHDPALPCRTSHRDGLPIPVLALAGATSYVSAEKRPFFLVAVRPDGMPGARGASG